MKHKTNEIYVYPDAHLLLLLWLLICLIYIYIYICFLYIYIYVCNTKQMKYMDIEIYYQAWLLLFV